MSQSGSFRFGPPGAPILTITGNAGGAVGPDGAGDITLTGTLPLTVTGTPATNSLDITIANATDISVGVIEIATDAETIAGASATLAVTPASLLAKLGTLTDHGILVGSGAAATITALGVATNGQLPIGSAGADPVLNTITAGAGIAIANGAGTITITATDSVVWNEVIVVGPTAMAVDNGYIANNAAPVTLTLPAVAAVGDSVRVTGKGAGLVTIAQNAGQTIHFSSQDTTPGIGGSITSTAQYDGVELLCITANDSWVVLSSIGNWVVV